MTCGARPDILPSQIDILLSQPTTGGFPRLEILHNQMPKHIPLKVPGHGIVAIEIHCRLDMVVALENGFGPAAVFSASCGLQIHQAMSELVILGIRYNVRETLHRHNHLGGFIAGPAMTKTWCLDSEISRSVWAPIWGWLSRPASALLHSMRSSSAHTKKPFSSCSARQFRHVDDFQVQVLVSPLVS